MAATGKTVKLGRLTRDAIRAADDLHREEVEVPEWGGSVLVQGMTGKQRDQFEQRQMIVRGRGRSRTAEMDLSNFRANVVMACCVNEDGTPLFTAGDLEWLTDKSAAALSRVAEVAIRLSGISEEDQGELLGNLEAGANGGSGLG